MQICVYVETRTSIVHCCVFHALLPSQLMHVDAVLASIVGMQTSAIDDGDCYSVGLCDSKRICWEVKVSEGANKGFISLSVSVDCSHHCNVLGRPSLSTFPQVL